MKMNKHIEEAPFSIEPRYCIKPGYRHRTATAFWDDTRLRDEWQREVYLCAAAILGARPEQLTQPYHVYDVGCGSGYKLMKYFGQYETVGIDEPPTVAFLKSTYPTRDWCTIKEADRLGEADLVICSDVIEHVLEPDRLCEQLQSYLGPNSYLVISTPDRDLYKDFMDRRDPNGPPFHPAHVREWNFKEFGQYMRTHFEVLMHEVTGTNGQPTQMAICRLK